MAEITRAALNEVLDNLTRFYMRCIGTQASGYGLGAVAGGWGAQGVITTLKSDLLSAADLEPIVEIGDAVLALESGFVPDNVVASLLQQVLIEIQSHVTGVGLTGVTNLNSYLTYYNAGAGGTWLAKQHNSFRDLHDAWSPSACIDPWNVYFEVLQGATYANALRKLIVGTGETAGFTTMDTAKYSGGEGKLNVSGLTGSGNVTVTGTAFDPATKAAVTGRTWITAVNANGLTTLVVGGGTAPANSHICKVDSIAAAGGISAGTIYVEAHRPSGRDLLP